MNSLLAHILRTLLPHAERFAELPLTSVPSAAVSDEQTAAWSDELYARDLKADSTLPPWRALLLAAFGGLLAAATLTTGVARADVNVCSALHNSPTVATVEQLGLEFMADGWTPREAGEIIARSVVGGCAQYVPILEQFIAKWTPAKTVRS